MPLNKSNVGRLKPTETDSKDSEQRKYSFFMLKVMLAVKRAMGESESHSLSDKYRLVEDLGFDSLKMATLSIALEDALDETILLNEWISSSPSPNELTIESLALFIYRMLK